MDRRWFASFFRSIACLLAALFILAHPVVATAQQDASTVQAATPDQVAQFLANPASILAGNPSQADLAATIQSLALANSDNNQTLAALISLSQSLNAQASNPNNTPAQTAAVQAQMAAIGTGLANAATSVQTSNPTLAANIQSAVAASGVPTTVASFTAAGGGTQTAATGGAGGAGGGANPTNPTLPSGGGGGSQQAQNGQGQNGGGGGLTGGGGGGNGQGQNNQGNSVSPH